MWVCVISSYHIIYTSMFENYTILCVAYARTHTYACIHIHSQRQHTHMCLFEKSYAILNCDRQTFTLCLTHLLNLSHSFTFSRMVYLCVSVSLCVWARKSVFSFCFGASILTLMLFTLSILLKCVYTYDIIKYILYI